MATFFLFLILSLSSFCASLDDVSWNIDCGSSERSYTDDSGMKWVGDGTLIKSGTSKSVPSINSFDHVHDTLRLFTSGTKNCYSLKAKKGAKVLIQADFFYGNYDGKSSPPEFDLQVDGNDWITVYTTMDVGFTPYSELVYTVPRDKMSLCLVQTHPDQFPFISSLRIQSLPSGMYKSLDPKHAMINYARYAFGSDDSIRYPTDVYDRIWDKTELPESEYRPVKSETSHIDTRAVEDDVPAEVLGNAITTASSSNGTLKLSPPIISIPEGWPVYITMYFTEASKLDPAQKRSFSVYVDGELEDLAKALSPINGRASELSIYNYTVSENTTFTLVPTSDSTLPPLISAMEIYQIVDYNLTLSDSDPESSSSTKSKPLVIPGAGVLIFLSLISLFSSTTLHDSYRR